MDNIKYRFWAFYRAALPPTELHVWNYSPLQEILRKRRIINMFRGPAVLISMQIKSNRNCFPMDSTEVLLLQLLVMRWLREISWYFSQGDGNPSSQVLRLVSPSDHMEATKKMQPQMAEHAVFLDICGQQQLKFVHNRGHQMIQYAVNYTPGLVFFTTAPKSQLETHAMIAAHNP